MNQTLKSLTWIIIASIFFLGCNEKLAEKVKIAIESTTQPGVAIKISSNDGLEEQTFIEAKADSSGKSTIEVALEKPVFALLQIGNKYAEVYLSPGDDLHIKEVGQDYIVPLRFSGRGAEVNNYISYVNSKVEELKWKKGKGLQPLDYNEFSSFFDSLKIQINGFHKSYIDSVDLPDEMISKLEQKNNIKLLGIAHEFKFFKRNNILNEKWEAQRNGKEYVSIEVPKAFENLTNEVPFDGALLAEGYADYQMLLNWYWYNNINLAVSENFLTSKDSLHLAPLMSNALIKKVNYPESIREFLIAFDLKYSFAANGITPETDSVYSDFKRTYPTSTYQPALNKIYDEWLAIAPGKPAPDFEGYTVDSKKISIKDLKGKVVYMDVWATWCGPCVAEIPYSKELQQEFSKERDLLFLSVSVDNRKSDWEKFIMKENTWKGLHINIEPDKTQSLYKAYRLFGVPDYILIDHAGNIVNMKAPRPSEKNVSEEIQKVLDKVPGRIKGSDRKTQTLTLHYNAIACPCAQWSEDTKKDDRDYYYLEAADNKLIDAEDLFDGRRLPLVVEVTGQVVSTKGYPEGYDPAKGIEAGNVFRYTKIKVLQNGPKKKGS